MQSEVGSDWLMVLRKQREQQRHDAPDGFSELLFNRKLAGRRGRRLQGEGLVSIPAAGQQGADWPLRPRPSV